MATRTWNRLDYIFKLMVILALAIYGTILLRDIVIPLAFAIFLALVLLPVVKKIERRTGTTLAVTIVVVGGTILFGLLTWLLINQIIGLVNDLPNLQERANTFVNEIKGLMWSELNIDQADLNQMVQDFLKGVSVYLGALLLTTGNTLATIVQIPIYMFLLLIYRDKFKKFFVSLFPRNDEELLWKKRHRECNAGLHRGPDAGDPYRRCP